MTDSIDSPSGFGNVAKHIVENICENKIENNIELAHQSWQYTGMKKTRWERNWQKPIEEFPIHQHRFGKDNPMYGRKHSAKTKKLMSQIKKLKQ